MTLWERYQRDGRLDTLDLVVQALRDAVDGTPEGDPYRCVRLSNLGGALWERHERTGRPDDLDAAVAAQRGAVESTPPGHPLREKHQTNLGLALSAWHERTGDPGCLGEAVDLFRQVAAATSPDHPHRAQRLSNLGNTLRIRYERTGNPEDLDEAVEACREAVDAAPASGAGSGMDLARLLSNLGIAYWARYIRTGTAGDLDDAIAVHRRAIEAADPEAPGWARLLSNLGNALSERYDRDGSLASLDEAVTTYRRGVAAALTDPPDRMLFLYNLANSLKSRHERTDELASLDEAIQAYRDAISGTPADHPSHAMALAGLSSALRIRDRFEDDRHSLDESVRVIREALDATPAGHPLRGRRLHSLGCALLTEYGRTRDAGVLDEAIRELRAAVAADPADHPDRGNHLTNLGQALLARAEQREDAPARREAVEAFRQAAGTAGAPTTVLADASCAQGEVSASILDWDDASSAFGVAVGLLPRLASRQLDRGDQEHRLSAFQGLASAAAACALRTGRPDRALELLEQGRGVLLGQALEARGDLADLAVRAPKLAAELARLGRELDRPYSDVEPGAAVQARYELSNAWERTVERIREIPDFTPFLVAPALKDLLPQAEEGPVVTLNVSSYRSDALVLARDGLHVVRLRDVRPDVVREHVDTFLRVLDEMDAPETPEQTVARGQESLRKVLGWLWDAVAEPVLDALDLRLGPAPGQPWPRVWWSAAGLLGFLPIHAAGYHEARPGPGSRAVMDRVVSSSIPTIGALRHARERRRPVPRPRALVVAMPHTPGERDLRGAVPEADIVAARFRRSLRLTGGEATRERVLAELRACTSAHFACHARSDLRSPSDGRLMLHDHLESPLDVLDVSRLRLEEAELAFLSSCSTARSSAGLMDEPIHLTSAFQVAGFTHVVGTLWPIADRAAARVAGDVYAALDSQAAGGLNREPALALHAAIRRLRAARLATPSLWASHVHAGP